MTIPRPAQPEATDHVDTLQVLADVAEQLAMLTNRVRTMLAGAQDAEARGKTTEALACVSLAPFGKGGIYKRFLDEIEAMLAQSVGVEVGMRASNPKPDAEPELVDQAIRSFVRKSRGTVRTLLFTTFGYRDLLQDLGPSKDIYGEMGEALVFLRNMLKADALRETAEALREAGVDEQL